MKKSESFGKNIRYYHVAMTMVAAQQKIKNKLQSVVVLANFTNVAALARIAQIANILNLCKYIKLVWPP